jgi:hypothetical protein
MEASDTGAGFAERRAEEIAGHFAAVKRMHALYILSVTGNPLKCW